MNRMIWNRSQLSTGLVLICLLAGAAVALGQGGPDYSAASASVNLPFLPQNPPLEGPPKLYASVTLPSSAASPATGNVVVVTLDTGSTGLLLTPDHLPGYQTVTDTPGYQFYSSSKLLSVGKWVPVTVTFYGLDQSTSLATASVPALVVEQQVVCPGYKAGGVCPCKAGESACACGPGMDPDMSCSCPSGGTCPLYPVGSRNRMAYMGVGFGQEPDFMPQGTPDKNALLNLATLNGQPIAAGALSPGYILGSTGVTVGLTPANTSGFRFIKLYRSPADSSDWAPASMCVQINGSSCFSGSLLVDTGVNQSYITVTTPLFSDTVSPPDKKGPAVLKAGTTVTVQIPAPTSGQPTPVVADSYIVGQSSPCQPPMVIPRWPINSSETMKPFVNTGRYFLRKYQFLYDFANGWIGLSPPAGGCGG